MLRDVCPDGIDIYFDNTAGPYSKTTWHLIEAYFKLNTIVNGIAARDGIIRYWYDGTLIMEHVNIVMRTGANSTPRW